MPTVSFHNTLSLYGNKKSCRPSIIRKAGQKNCAARQRMAQLQFDSVNTYERGDRYHIRCSAFRMSYSSPPMFLDGFIVSHPGQKCKGEFFYNQTCRSSVTANTDSQTQDNAPNINPARYSTQSRVPHREWQAFPFLYSPPHRILAAA